ncbi:MAG: HD domain-containing protein, partial [Oscillochloris sp.]|nr:HD domain-containing protein [Oscillochloris sp.]
EQARFERLIQLSPDGIAILAADSRVLLVNSALTLLLGADNPLQLVGQSLLTYLASDSLDRYHAGVAPLLSGEQHAARIELSMLPIAGPQIPVEVSIGQFADYDGAAFQVIVRDISLRKLAEAQIQRQISQLTSLHAIGVAITASLDLDITLPVLIDRMIEHLHIDAVNLLLLNSMTQLLDPSASRGLACLNSQLPSMRSDEGLPGIAYLTRRPVVISALSNEDLRCDRDRLLRKHFCSYIAIPLQARNQVLGVIEIMQRERFEPDHNWWVFLEALSVQAAIAIDTARLFVQIQHAHQELTLSYNATIEGWSRALDLRDHETEGHSARVTELSLQLARRMNLSDEDLDHVRRGALLHDIGKMGVPDRILLKPGPLSAEEWQVMRLHPIHAYEWLSPIPFLHPALAIPYAHHERWDGSGYPRGLRGEQIPLTARIFAVVDVWDALRSMRPYRTPWPEERVMLHIQSLSGTHFDPQVVGVFLDLIREQQEMAREA